MPGCGISNMGIVAMALCLAGCATGGSTPQSARLSSVLAEDQRFASDIDAFLVDAMTRLDTIPAISVAVVRSDGPIYRTALGEADIEAETPATPSTLFYIASSTKSFVGFALALLDSQGEIDLDWTLTELAPDIEFASELRADEVTLRHLLDHSHGLSGDPIEFRLAYSGEHDPETLWRLLGRLEPNADAPLGTFDYSNLGYNVATLLIERRLGWRWQDIVDDRVLRPLGMARSYTQRLEEARAASVFAAPYFGLAPGEPERLYLVKADETMQSAGGMYSTADDMARWLQLQLAAETGEDTPGFRADVVAASHRSTVALDSSFAGFPRTGYGLGWYSGDYKGATLYHAFGSFAGSRSHVSFQPDHDIGIAIMSNDEGAGFRFVDIAAAYVYDWYDDGPEAAAESGELALARLVEQASAGAAAIAESHAERANRPWLLSLPHAAYVGRYCDDDYGTFDIETRGNGLIVTMGRLHADAEAFTETDAIRLELVPNSGEVMRFGVANGAVETAHIFGSTFLRCI